MVLTVLDALAHNSLVQIDLLSLEMKRMLLLLLLLPLLLLLRIVTTMVIAMDSVCSNLLKQIKKKTFHAAAAVVVIVVTIAVAFSIFSSFDFTVGFFLYGNANALANKRRHPTI